MAFWVECQLLADLNILDLWPEMDWWQIFFLHQTKIYIKKVLISSQRNESPGVYTGGKLFHLFVRMERYNLWEFNPKNTHQKFITFQYIFLSLSRSKLFLFRKMNGSPFVNMISSLGTCSCTQQWIVQKKVTTIPNVQRRVTTYSLSF